MDRTYKTFRPAIRAPLFLRLLCLVLLGYALFGKGFAYIGITPFYVGELALFIGIVSIIGRFSLSDVFSTVTSQWLLSFTTWCALRTIPYIGVYGLDAFRDGVIWGYSAFAFILAGFVTSRPYLLRWFEKRYQTFCILYATLALPLWLVYAIYRSSLPQVGGDVYMIEPKAGDLLVHYGACLCAIAIGFVEVPMFAIIALTIGALVTSVGTRGGTLALLGALTVTLPLCQFRKTGKTFGVIIIVIAVVFLTKTTLNLQYGARDLSLEQLSKNMQSVIVSADSNLQGTKQWRAAWWQEIIQYTFYGEHWTGKGFGIDLAKADGHALPERTLRSPHSCHFTLLGRAGVPGLFLWICVQVSWCLGITHSLRLALSRRQQKWIALFGVLLAYWTAILINASFDVVLEGPMGGIWFWSVVGVGIGARVLYLKEHKQFKRPLQTRPLHNTLHLTRPTKATGAI